MVTRNFKAIVFQDVTNVTYSMYYISGMVGQPNAGKSSLINSLMGKRVVSVSKTPGHTKHFQTIHITRSVVLMDCPGLVFPSVVDRPLQVRSCLYRKKLSID